MNIPDKVRIGSCDYDVIFTEKDIVAKGRECMATIEFNTHLISISTKLGDKQSNEISFLHEVIHGIIRERNLEIEGEELVVEEFARGLHQLIRDNPEIFKW